MAYATVAELRGHMGIAAADTAEDTRLSDALDAATAWIDSLCGQSFASTSATRTFAARDPWTLDLSGSPLTATITSVKTDAGFDGTFETTLAVTDYLLLPVGGRQLDGSTGPYTSIRYITSVWPIDFVYGRPGIQIVGTFGWAAVPAAVKTACLLQAAHLQASKDTPLGVAGFGDIGIRTVRGENPMVRALLSKFMVKAAVA